MKNRGAYVLANDHLYEWVVAFLESFRTHNPDLSLYLIPFNEQYDRVADLTSTYKVEIFEHPSFEVLEEIGGQLELGVTATGPHWFRRFASFWGPLDEFIYLDCRMVVLADVKPLIQALNVYHCDFLHFEGGLDQVYEPGPVRTELVRDGRAQGFNSGRWISKKGLFSLNHMHDVAKTLVLHREQMNHRNTDQFFLNYLVHTSDIRYASVHTLMPELSRLTWPRIPGTIYREEGRYKVWNHGRPEHDKEVIFMHWAGIEKSPGMERRWLFRRYRLRAMSRVEQVAFRLREMLLQPPFAVFNWLKRRRTIHRVYDLFRKG